MGTLTGWHPSRPGCSPRRSRGERERLRSRGEALTQSALCLTRLHMCPRRGQAGGRAGRPNPRGGGRERQRETGDKISQTPKAEQKKLFPEALRSWPPWPLHAPSLSRSRGPLAAARIGRRGVAGAVGGLLEKISQNQAWHPGL